MSNTGGPQIPLPPGSGQNYGYDQGYGQPLGQDQDYGQPMGYGTTYGQGPGGAYGLVANPGKGLGIAGIVLGIFLLWLIGLPLAITSWVKSSRAQASVVLGVVGTILNVLSIFGSIVFLTILVPMILIMMNPGSTTSPKPHQSGSSAPSATSKASDKPNTDQSQNQNQDPNQGSSGVVTLADSYSVQAGNAYWAFPAPPAGWELTTFDEEGVNQMTSADGNQRYITMQGMDNYAGMSDEDASRQAIEDYVGSIGTLLGEETTVTFVQMSDGTQVEFLVAAFTFAFSDGTEAEGVISARVFDGGHYLVTVYDSTQGFDEEVWSELTAQTMISDEG